jgi:DNA-binding transcriptional LysR family regulator
MLNFNQLRTFHYAAKHRSFTVAASTLFVSQPAITAQIKALEAECSLKLFKRKGRQVHLTEEGKTLYEYTQKIFQYEKEIENIIDDMKELKRGVLRVGSTKTYARYFMPSLLSSFHQDYPHIKLHLDEGSSLDMTNSLLEFKNEVAVIAKATENPDVTFIPLSQEELIIIVSANHPLAAKRSVSPQELAKEPLIMKETGSGTRKRVSMFFEQHHCTPNALMETSNTEFIKQLVQKGEGISILVKACVAAEIEEGKLATVPLIGQRIYLDVSFAHLKDQPLSVPARAFEKVLKKLRSEDMRPQDIGALMLKILAQQG